MKNFRIISLATALVFLFTLVPVRLTADVYVGDGDYSVTDPAAITSTDFVIYENGYLYCYKGTASEVVIPDGVTVIGWASFSGKDNITSVTIPEGVEVIEHGAFEGCSNLTSVSLPDGLLEIQSEAFAHTGISEITLPEGLIHLGNGAFRNTNLQSVEIPNNVGELLSDTFAECQKLTSIHLGSGIYSVNIDGLWSLTSITVDEYNPCYSSIDGVLFNSNATELVKYPSAREGTTYTVPDTVNCILTNAFRGSQNLTNIILPENLFSIDHEAFAYSSIENINIPDSVDSIGSMAFDGCEKLSSLKIGSGFSGDANLFCYLPEGCSVTISENNPNFCTSDGVVYNKDMTVLYKHFDKSAESFTIPETVTSIYNEAFSGHYNLTSIDIPTSVTSIGSRAFADCTSLTDVSLSENLTNLEYGVFQFCENLTQIVLPETLQTIGDSAFYFCYKLSSVNIPSGVTRIGDSAFSSCYALESINIPESIEYIGTDAFYSCLAAEGNIIIPSTIKHIGDNAFGYCKKITAIEMPERITLTEEYEPNIRWYTFNHCESLTSINIPEGIRIIDCYAFSGCSSLNTVIIPHTVEAINSSAFCGCPIETIYYRGTEAQYQSIDIQDDNNSLLTANVIYEGYSGTSSLFYEELYSTISNRDTARIAEILQTKEAKNAFPMLESVCNFDGVANLMCQSGCDSFEKLEMAICVQLLNEKNCGKDYFDNYFRNFDECFSNLFAVYSEQTIDVQQIIVDNMQGREFCDLYDAEKNFAHITFLMAFQKSEGYAPAKHILLVSADCLKIDITHFESLSTANQNRIIMQLISYDFYDLADFRNRFCDLCYCYQDLSRPSGGGSSGGSSGSAVYWPTLTYNAENYTVITDITNSSENDLSFELKLARGSDTVLANYESFVAETAICCAAAENYSYEWHLEEILSGCPSGTYTVFLKQSDEVYTSIQFEYTSPEGTESEIYFNTNIESYVESIDGGVYNFINVNFENQCEAELKFDIYIIQDGFSITDDDYAFHHTLTCQPNSSYSYEINTTQQLADYPSGGYALHIVESSTGRIDSYNFEHTSTAEVNNVLSRINSTNSAEELYQIIQENCDYLGIDIWKLEKLKDDYRYDMLYKLIDRCKYESIADFKANYDELYETYKAQTENDNNNQGGSVSGGGGGGSSEGEIIDGPYVEITNVKTLPGKTVTVELMLENNTGFSNLGVQIRYDNSAMSLTSIDTNTDIGVECYSSEIIETIPYVMTWFSNSNCDFNGRLATLTFELKADTPSGFYPITVEHFDGPNDSYTDGADVNYDENFNPINLSYKFGEIEIIDHIPGDITGDEEVDYYDAFALIRYIVNGNGEISENALDINGDGSFNNKDATVLLRWLAGWDVEIY